MGVKSFEYAGITLVDGILHAKKDLSQYKLTENIKGDDPQTCVMSINARLKPINSLL